MSETIFLKPVNQKYKEYTILVISTILYIVACVFQIRMPIDAKGWQGVVAQIQVMISVYLTVRVIFKGYIVAVILNGLFSVMAAIQVIFTKNMFALPGIVIPICTIIIISIIALFNHRLKAKTNEVIIEKSKSSKEIIELQEVSIMAMAALAETRDNETGRHIQRTKLYVKVLGEYLYVNGIYKDTLDSQMLDLIVASAPLHDIGKVGIPDSILLKPGKLTEEEFEIIKRHTALGYDAIVKSEKLIEKAESFLKYAGEIILYHHERWDGNGYLNNLKELEIPLSARIMSVADVYDALTSKRVYKEIHSHEMAVDIISSESGKQFDPEVVKAFNKCRHEFKRISEAYKDDQIA